MVVDASAIVAIMLDEAEASFLRERLANAPSVWIPAPAMLEALIVLRGRRSEDPVPLFNLFLADVRAEVISLGEAHARAAFEAFLRFGKGRHPASLNFGDCMVYAVAKMAGLPLLYVGDDFAKTDIIAA